MFVASYIIILSLSAACGAWVALMGMQRMAFALGTAPKYTHGTAAVTAAIAFLVVVAAPGGVLLGAIALMLGSYFSTHERFLPLHRFGVLMLAIAMGVAGLSVAPLYGLPVWALLGAGALVWLLVTFSGELLPETYMPGALAAAVALLPLCASSFFHAPGWIAVDATLILSGLLGAALTKNANARIGTARMALAFLVGWLMVVALLHGAWLPAVLSLAFWLAALGYAYYEDPSRKNYAFDF